MKTTLTYTKEDFYESVRLFQRTSRSAQFIRYFLPAIGAFLLIFLYSDWNQDSSRIFHVIMALFFILFPTLIMRYMAHKAYTTSKLANLSMELEFTEEGLSSKSSLAESKVVWSLYRRAVVTSTMVLVFQSERLYSFFPRHCFTDEAWEYFISLVRKKVVTKNL